MEDLLETVGLVAQDDDFWNRLTSVDRPPSSEQLRRATQLDTPAFAALLEASGYGTPPPPPADELVNETVKALIAAASITDPGRAQSRIKFARSQLTTLVIRVRRQVRDPRMIQPEAGILKKSGEQLAQGARWVIPRAVAGAATALVELHAPGSGAGFVAGHALEEVAKDLTESAAGMFIGHPQPVSGDYEIEDLAWTQIDPISVHLAALLDRISALEEIGKSSTRSEAYKPLLDEAQRHLTRLKELISDSRAMNEDGSAMDAFCAVGEVLDMVLKRKGVLTHIMLLDGGTELRVIDMEEAKYSLTRLRARLKYLQSRSNDLFG